MGGLAVAGAGLPALARAPASAPLLAPADQTLPLWRDAPPGGGGAGLQLAIVEQGHDPAQPDRWLTGIARPVLILRRPARPNGAAVLILPGGGYGFLSYDNEGARQAAWLNALGVTAYILLYRLPGEGWGAGSLAPLQDAQRAMRAIRGRAAVDGIDPRRVAVLGFSAGGHLAGSLATRHAEHTYPPTDAEDGLSARPDLAALIYPVVSMSSPSTHLGSRDKLLGLAPAEEARRRFSVELSVEADTPPTFLVHAGDDGLVPVANSLMLYEALRAMDRPAELHVFAEGGHGFGVRAPATLPVSHWPELLTAFARRRELFAA
jgi:acetyl esterase/lipase